MATRRNDIASAGFSLIELLVMIVIVGILAAIAMQSMVGVVLDTREVKTEREMEMLARAIVGDPNELQGGMRADFGYVGDVGAFPPSLDALRTNPGGYSTWRGPYLPPGLTEDAVGFKTDEWGNSYQYSGGMTIVSTGSGSSIIKKLAEHQSDYLQNTFNGVVLDAGGAPPGPVYMDSVTVAISVPDGFGGMTTESTQPDSAGLFSIGDLPAGRHRLEIEFIPNVDTLVRYATVLPRHNGTSRYKFAADYFGGSPSGFGRRCELIIVAARVPDDLTGFPLLLTERNLPQEMLDANGAHGADNGGGDIRFTLDIDGTNTLPCEVVDFTTHNNPALASAEIWVRVPSVSASVNTSIWVWYDRPGEVQPPPDDPGGAHLVWDSTWVVVQHMDNNTGCSSPQMLDATDGSNDGTSHGGMNSSDLVSGQIGRALDFDGNNDYIRIPASGVTVTGTEITMEGWMYLRDATGRANLFQRGTNYALWEIRNGGTPYNVFYDHTWRKFNFGQPATWFLDDWHYVVCTYDGANVRTYIDGDPDQVYAYTSNLNPTATNHDLGIALNAGWNDSYYRGRADEIRVSRAVRSAAFIKAQFNNHDSPQTFVLPQSPETP
ncbi:prepilin-type N-terminal cleavage/methylation domain-containing protein [candidate division GN15 bacterium]|nr:prepilin-type N-terminal cleavage/methylation domain-containing protein [candidate division GN15 bacterium]